MAIGICSLGLFTAALTAAGPAAAGAPSSQFIDDAATQFLKGRNAELVTGTPAARVAAAAVAEAPGLQVRETRARGALKDRRDRLAAHGERYSAARTEASVLSTHQVGDTLVARVNEKTELDYVKVRGDEPPTTAYSVDRDFTFERSANGWALADVRMVEPDAVLPVNEVADPATAPASSASQPSDATRMTSRPSTSAAPGGKGARTGSGVSTLAAYDYSAMLDYANRYWYYYNSSYRSYSNDCTNFISQIMAAGGWQYVNSNLAQSDSRRWDYGWFTYTTSYTWAGAENWNQFAIGSGRTTRLAYASDLLTSDVLQMDFNKDYNINHTMIVTATSGSEKYLTYHTTDTHDRSLTSILQAYPTTTTWYYAHRT